MESKKKGKKLDKTIKISEQNSLIIQIIEMSKSTDKPRYKLKPQPEIPNMFRLKSLKKGRKNQIKEIKLDLTYYRDRKRSKYFTDFYKPILSKIFNSPNSDFESEEENQYEDSDRQEQKIDDNSSSAKDKKKDIQVPYPRSKFCMNCKQYFSNYYAHIGGYLHKQKENKKLIITDKDEKIQPNILLANLKRQLQIQYQEKFNKNFLKLLKTEQSDSSCQQQQSKPRKKKTSIKRTEQVIINLSKDVEQNQNSGSATPVFQVPPHQFTPSFLKQQCLVD